jgi:hypothetical protein
MSKQKCDCGNEIGNLDDTIEIQWIENFGCEKCLEILGKHQDKIREESIITEKAEDENK